MIAQSRDTDLKVEAVQIELLRQAGFTRKATIARSLSQNMIGLNFAD